ncbi:MAG: type II toxin-antitoxin system HicA family toxin [Patescibacteria group bacterium]
MSILPILSAREVMRKLHRGGFLFTHTKGSHHFFHHMVSNRTTSVPLHGGNDIGRKLLSKIIKQTGLSVEEFNKL